MSTRQLAVGTSYRQFLAIRGTKLLLVADDDDGNRIMSRRATDQVVNTTPRSAKELVLRGCNNAHLWWDDHNRLLAYAGLEHIASHGFNSVRVVWSVAPRVGLTVALLRSVIQRVVELGMVPVLTVHDATGDTIITPHPPRKPQA
eukprot:5708179-Pyramimonas_sp.AAC.2